MLKNSFAHFGHLRFGPKSKRNFTHSYKEPPKLQTAKIWENLMAQIRFTDMTTRGPYRVDCSAGLRGHSAGSVGYAPLAHIASADMLSSAFPQLPPLPACSGLICCTRHCLSLSRHCRLDRQSPSTFTIGKRASLRSKPQSPKCAK